MGRPKLHDIRNASFVAREFGAHVAVGIVLAKEPSAVQLNLFAGNNPVAVVFVADVLGDRSKSVGRKRSGPKVVSTAPVGHGRKLELIALIKATKPKTAGKHGVAIASLGNLIACRVKVPPHVATTQNSRTNVINVEVGLSP